MNNEIRRLTKQLQELYSTGRIDSQSSIQASKLYDRLEKICESFEDYYYVVSNVDSRGGRRNKFVKLMLKTSRSMYEFTKVARYLPESWKREQRLLVKQALHETHIEKRLEKDFRQVLSTLGVI